jgi:hypothetical protein
MWHIEDETSAALDAADFTTAIRPDAALVPAAEVLRVFKRLTAIPSPVCG